MEKNCKTCVNESPSVMVPYVVHESAMARQERQSKRLWAVIIVLIVSLILTNLSWIIYEKSFEDIVTTEEIIVDADDDGNANYIGHDGNIYNGEDYGEENNENS